VGKGPDGSWHCVFDDTAREERGSGRGAMRTSIAKVSGVLRRRRL